MASSGMTKNRREIVYGRTELGQTVYDIFFSSLSAAEVVRRHSRVTRKFVLDMRRKHPKLRRRSK